VGVIAVAGVALHGGGAPARAVASPSATSPSATSPSATSPSATSPSATSASGPAQTDAFVVHQAEAALANADDYIIVTAAGSGPGQVTTTYTDPSTGTGRSVISGSGDKVAYWIQARVAGDEDQWQTTYVDYTSHTWWTKASHSGRLGQDTSGLIVLSADSTPADLSKALAVGEVGVGQRAEVDGHAAIELVYAGKLAQKAQAVHFWIDAKTYEPVQIDLPPFTTASTITESWIPKTAANVAQANKPQVPAGFRQVPPSSAVN
jgi:hypothetical protein